MTCKGCGQEFERHNNAQRYCGKACFNEARKNNADRKSYQVGYVSDRRRKVKQRAIEYLGGVCSRCGYGKCPAALEFHHVDPAEKDVNIAAMHRTWESIKKELDRCVLLCSNCHREVHYELNTPDIDV